MRGGDQRRSNPRDLVIGTHPVLDLLGSASPEHLAGAKLYLAQGRSATMAQKIRDAAHQAQVPFETVNTSQLQRLCPDANHQGVVLVVPPFPYTSLEDVFNREPAVKGSALFLLCLDQVQDPHNLGALIRSATAFGVDAVVITRDRCAQVNPTVVKVSVGTAYRTPIVRVTNLATALRELAERGFHIFGAAGDAESVPSDLHWVGPLALVMGAEGHGLRRLTRAYCHALVRIPHLPMAESLNVSVAAGVLLYHAHLSRSSQVSGK